jgi:hypothetical protein
MPAALELGRLTFLAPIGYLNAPRALGKSLMPDPERAPLVRRAFEEWIDISSFDVMRLPSKLIKSPSVAEGWRQDGWIGQGRPRRPQVSCGRIQQIVD